MATDYLGSVGLDTLREWAEEELAERGGQVVAPIISVSGSTVTITCATPDADIRYTLDKSEPTKGSTKYTAPFTVDGTVTIKAKAYKDPFVGSKTTTAHVVIARVWAVQWNYGNSSPALTRLTPETDPLGLVTETVTTEPNIEITGNSAPYSSPFDGAGPWGEMKRRNFVNNAPAQWEGEDGFSTTLYDTMVWIPKFWIKVVDHADTQKREYYLSDQQINGFELHPGSGMYIGAYVTSNNNQSMAGQSFQVNQTIVTMRTNAKSKGAGWQLVDLAVRNAVQFLFIIEFANWNSQGIFNQTAGTQNQTGLTDSLTYHTGYNGKVRYRWIEDLWNGVYEWTDGFNTVNGHHYVCTDPSKYQSDVTTDYTELGSWGFIGYIAKLKYFEDMQWLIGVPESGGGSNSTYVPDYGYLYTSGTLVLAYGGDWHPYALIGLFCFTASLVSSGSRPGDSSRLAYRPAS